MSERKFLNERDGFKVGDRVKVVNYYIREFNGMTGTIYKIDGDGCLNFDVILDNFIDGHDGHAGDSSTNHRFFSVPDLKLLSSTWHNVGDWVQVRSYLSTEKSYGGIYPSEQMLHKVGQKVRIKAVTKTGRYKIEGSCFTWTNEMFEEVKKETPVETKTEKTTRFKVGDKVKVRNDLKIGSRYSMDDSNVADTFVSEMSEFKGETVTISEITASGKYLVEEDDGLWNWTDDMFEDKKVEPTKNRKLKVGDRIRMTQNFCAAKVGMTGVIKFKRELDFAVEFDDEFVGGHSCGGRVKSHRGHYVQAIHFEVIEKIEKVDEKPTPKIEVGDVVRAIDNHYGVINLGNQWEGVVISVFDGKFTALTTNHRNLTDFKYDRCCGLDPKHFEIIKKNT